MSFISRDTRSPPKLHQMLRCFPCFLSLPFLSLLFLALPFLSFPCLACPCFVVAWSPKRTPRVPNLIDKLSFPFPSYSYSCEMVYGLYDASIELAQSWILLSSRAHNKAAVRPGWNTEESNCTAWMLTYGGLESQNYRRERNGKRTKCQLALQGLRKTVTFT